MDLRERVSDTPTSGRDFALVHETCDWAEVLCAFGELDISVAPEFQSAITRHLNGRLPLAIDMEFCEYLDSTILRALVRSFRSAPTRIGIVVPESSRIARIFQMTHLDETLRVVKSRDELRERLLA